MAITNNLGCFIFFIKQVGVYSSCTDVVQRPFPGFPSESICLSYGPIVSFHKDSDDF
jgi:hypothetical protein